MIANNLRKSNPFTPPPSAGWLLLAFAILSLVVSIWYCRASDSMENEYVEIPNCTPAPEKYPITWKRIGASLALSLCFPLFVLATMLLHDMAGELLDDDPGKLLLSIVPLLGLAVTLPFYGALFSYKTSEKIFPSPRGDRYI